MRRIYPGVSAREAYALQCAAVLWDIGWRNRYDVRDIVLEALRAYDRQRARERGGR